MDSLLESADGEAAAEAAQANFRLQGDWFVVGMEGEGLKATAEQLRGMGWTIQGTTITATDPNGSTGKMQYKLNLKASPRQFDITALQGKQAGQTDPGIYELKDGRPRICYRAPDNKEGKRPQDFSDANRSGYGMIILEKVETDRRQKD
jgi:uncharacterized protein (TIGR03067 family)